RAAAVRRHQALDPAAPRRRAAPGADGQLRNQGSDCTGPVRLTGTKPSGILTALPSSPGTERQLGGSPRKVYRTNDALVQVGGKLVVRPMAAQRRSGSCTSRTPSNEAPGSTAT